MFTTTENDDRRVDTIDDSGVASQSRVAPARRQPAAAGGGARQRKKRRRDADDGDDTGESASKRRCMKRQFQELAEFVLDMPLDQENITQMYAGLGNFLRGQLAATTGTGAADEENESNGSSTDASYTMANPQEEELEENKREADISMIAATSSVSSSSSSSSGSSSSRHEPKEAEDQKEADTFEQGLSTDELHIVLRSYLDSDKDEVYVPPNRQSRVNMTPFDARVEKIMHVLSTNAQSTVEKYCESSRCIRRHADQLQEFCKVGGDFHQRIRSSLTSSTVIELLLEDDKSCVIRPFIESLGVHRTQGAESLKRKSSKSQWKYLVTNTAAVSMVEDKGLSDRSYQAFTAACGLDAHVQNLYLHAAACDEANVALSYFPWDARWQKHRLWLVTGVVKEFIWSVESYGKELSRENDELERMNRPKNIFDIDMIRRADSLLAKAMKKIRLDTYDIDDIVREELASYLKGKDDDGWTELEESYEKTLRWHAREVTPERVWKVDVDQCYRRFYELSNADKGTNDHWRMEFRTLAAKGRAQKHLHDVIPDQPLSREQIEKIARSVISEKYHELHRDQKRAEQRAAQKAAERAARDEERRVERNQSIHNMDNGASSHDGHSTYASENRNSGQSQNGGKGNITNMANNNHDGERSEARRRRADDGFRELQGRPDRSRESYNDAEYDRLVRGRRRNWSPPPRHHVSPSPPRRHVSPSPPRSRHRSRSPALSILERRLLQQQQRGGGLRRSVTPPPPRRDRASGGAGDDSRGSSRSM